MVLSLVPNVPHSDYINASYIDVSTIIGIAMLTICSEFTSVHSVTIVSLYIMFTSLGHSVGIISLTYGPCIREPFCKIKLRNINI